MIEAIPSESIASRLVRADEAALEEVYRIHGPTVRAYLRHLFLANEMLGPILLSWHNLSYYQQLLGGLRKAIAENRTAEFRSLQLAGWGDSF